MASTKVYLVPGFFGFTSIGALNYFHRVDEILGEELAKRGVDAEIIECPTQPTGSIRNRAEVVLQHVLDTEGDKTDHIHLIGHSTGGLDIRLLATPGVQLRADDSEERATKNLRSCISVATPHYGTPLANFFTTFQGRHLLYALTVLATSTQGRSAIFLGSQLMRFVADVDDFLGRDKTFLDQVSTKILERVSIKKDDPIWQFLEEVSKDQGAIIQLTPEGMNLFNAAVTDRANVYYGCLVTAAPPPFAHKLRDLLRPEVAIMALAFAFLYKLSSREHIHYPYPSPAHTMRGDIEALLPFGLTGKTNDGVVPTLSQLHGEPIDAVVGDHLDVVGQFAQFKGDTLSDWLPSGSGFDDARFRSTWAKIADKIVASME